MKVIFIFIDGIGVGNENRETNPIYAAKTQVLWKLMAEARFLADASLGVPGLPQSATGQTAIFTGVNAPAVLNRHMSGQPTITLKRLIQKLNLFGELNKLGLTVTSANVYRDEYLRNMLEERDRRNKPSVTSVMGMAQGIKFRTVKEFMNNNGVYHDLTGERLKESGYEVDLVTPETAAKNLYALSRSYDFTLYEHFITDIAGHKFEMDKAVEVVEKLDRFLGELIRMLDFEKDVLIITSDHGNLEDLSVRTHTMSKVPVIIKGTQAERAETIVHSLVDIMPFILELFRRGNKLHDKEN
ncbi:2,3-bisphosphoglycerate-independent phosphoglycerate mutase [Ruminiclostridium hungatei]|uniref:2,3-bisphosphoglycerate-independent phosphoglycerate mutase n=1 Tax=Ruminiclostridium hungatei TaxID=48256 RepID=A0A1V4SRE1_RUMHU|nr:alkaline phosphatase family protein [Ruminiclostridium hungatei]OPX45851.1 2,3-bisphosphoglycerate-independent phosphoglycerate mutase [Ruminiclostridium hungatei]